MAADKKIDIKIGVLRERTVITPERGFKQILEIRYEIGEASHLFTIDKEGSTPEVIEAGIREDAAKFANVEHKTITL